MSEYLWPARAEYLRRGTPVKDRIGRRWLVLGPPRGTAHVFDTAGGPSLMVRETRLDLRDVTARAHAAMAYTRTDNGGAPYLTKPLLDVLDRYEVGTTDRLPVEHDAEVLCRMRALDEFVTVAEARAALEWAEGVTS